MILRPARRRVLGVAATVALVLVGCSSKGDDTGSKPAVSTSPAPVPTDESGAPAGFTAVTVVVTKADGSTEERCVWLADDVAERSRGLMFVTDPGLGAKDGMVFVFPSDSRSSFYMKNTLLPLSIAYIDADGRIVSTADMDPCPADTVDCPLYPAGGPYRLALEVPQGGLPAFGIEERSRLALTDRAC